MDPLVLNLAPTGMVPTKDLTPHVPLNPQEIIADVLRCAELGITTVHLHARDEQGDPTHDKRVYARIISGIREVRDDLVLGVSCSGRSVSELELRAEVLDLDGDLKPDLASLTLSSLNFARQASVNSPEVIRSLAERMEERGIKAELEIFDLGMTNYACYLTEKGLLPGPRYANLFVGNVAGAQLDFGSLGALIGGLPPDTYWSLAGIGDAQTSATTVAVAMGGGVRTGLEDNIWHDPNRTQLTSNAKLVERIHDLAALSGRTVMSPSQFRHRFLDQ